MSFEKQKIQYYPIAPITDFVLTEHTNNLYKQVANSSIDLAKKCAEKINEVINSFNELAKEKWEKIHEQDGSIRSAILYMKDNLLNTVDSLLKTKGDEMMDNAVKEYLGTLKNELDLLTARLDNLLGSVTEGSTTLDAEVIDLRTAFDGGVYDSAGESVRTQMTLMTYIGISNYSRVLPNLNNATSPRYCLNFSTSTTNLPLNLPFETMPEPVVLLENYVGGNYGVQILTSKGKIWTRYKGGDNWSEWIDNSLVDAIVREGAFESVLPDLNEAKAKEYFFIFSTGTTSENLPLNMPIAEMPSAFGILKTYQLDNYKWQEFIISGTIYTRVYNGTSWSTWSGGEKSKYITTTEGNYSSRLPDVNNAQNEMTYILNFAIGTSNIPLNLPFETIPDTLLFLDTHIAGQYGYQELKPANNKYLYRRMYAHSYNDWYVVYNTSTEGEALRVTPTEGILNGLKSCYEKGITKLIVEAGEYNVISEYESYYGSTYFTDYVNYSTSDKFDRGLWLENIEVIFSPGAKVICHYTGDNQNVSDYFSPFAIGVNVIVNGLVLEASNCRYGIHPDYHSTTNRNYIKFINCDLKHYKSATNEQCIGSGFSVASDWLIENTIFRSENATHVLRVHNNGADDSQSKLVIKNCYIDGKGFFKFTHYGTSTKESTILVSGCSYITEPVVEFETSDSTIENMQLIKFNNEIRTE